MEADVIVIGAGVVGCMTARALSRYNLNTLVLEAGSDVAEGASKANSAIVHAGFDAKPGTNKAKFNVLGNRMFEDVCRELKVPFRRNGSLVLAFGTDEEKTLLDLRDRAAVNGVPVEIISGDELRRREPNVSPEATGALWAPTGGICCPYDLTFRAAENAAANGVEFAFDAKVAGISRVESEGRAKWRVVCEDGREFSAKAVVNAAGVHSDELNNLVSATKYSIQARRGEYLMLDRDEDGTFSATMFQVPSKMGKGILVSPTVDGTVIVGPTAEDIPCKEDKATTYEGLEKVKAGAMRTYPKLPLGKVITEFSGLRAHETTVGDFVLGEAPDAPCFFNAVGVESPGLTSAPAIGVFLADAVASRLGASRKNVSLISADTSHWPVTREMKPEDLAELVKRDPEYGRVICRCEGVTAGEIRAAIRARVGARTLDGIKRRTRSGMGRCQGGFCTPKLIEILSSELGLPPEAFLSSRKTAPKALRGTGNGEQGTGNGERILDVLVVGAGPAGLAAAVAAKKELGKTGNGETGNVLVLERDDAPGGILQQCIHNGFGLHRFGEELTGTEYAQRWIDMAQEAGVSIHCGAMVRAIESTADGIKVMAISPRGGLRIYKTKALVLAMGCRERPRGALMTPGTRPAGVYTAGTVQRLVNMDGIMPGRRVVILGSGDIGLIMARRLTFSGAKVLACIEIMKKSSGLARNVAQCLNDYGIPLLLSHTVTDVEGDEHVTGVKVSKVDDKLKPIPGTEMHFDCDTLVLSCGLIPENELTRAAGIEMDPATRGPKVDPKTMATSVPGIFAGGNVVRVYDLVDWVSRDSETAGRSAAQFAASRR